MLKKFSEALQLLIDNLALISAIVLTIWLPGNVVVGLLTRHLGDDPQALYTTLRATRFIESIFGPLYIGALLYALSRIRQGWSVSYGEAMREGLRNWGTLFGARLLAGLLVLLGLLALVVPGIILLLRYSFLDCAVVLEGASSGEARSRSTYLTRNGRGPILGAWVIFLVCYVTGSIVLYLPLALVSFLDNFAVNLFLDCLASVLYVVIEIVLFLYYWEAVEQERAQNQPSDDTAGPMPTFKLMD